MVLSLLVQGAGDVTPVVLGEMFSLRECGVQDGSVVLLSTKDAPSPLPSLLPLAAAAVSRSGSRAATRPAQGRARSRSRRWRVAGAQGCGGCCSRQVC